MVAFAFSADMVAWLNRPFPNPLVFYGPTEALFASIKVSFLAAVLAQPAGHLLSVLEVCRAGAAPQGAALGHSAVSCWPERSSLSAWSFVISSFFRSSSISSSASAWIGTSRRELSVGTYIDFNVKFLLMFGCAFELPLVLTILARVGVVSAQMLAKYRKHAILSALIISAIITPDATLFTMMLMAVPLMVLYEIGILGARIFGRGHQPTDVNLPLDPDLPMRTAGHRVR